MAFRLDKLKILLAEDVVPMRQLLVSILKCLGADRITSASNGEEAYELFCKFNHDIIIADWAMEPMGGIELTREIRNNDQSPNKMAPVILITGYSAWPRVEEARDTGVTEFLVKPFSAKDVARRITHVIANPRDFIETQDYFGPDRRRRIDPQYNGPTRREEDQKKYSAGGL